MYISEEDNIESKYQIVFPYILRGIIIHLLNGAFDY